MIDKFRIVRSFFPDREIAAITPLGTGKINETWQVEFAGGDPGRAVLQKLNGDVFTAPERIMANLRRLADHLKRVGGCDLDRPVIVFPYLTVENTDLHRDGNGDFWRMLSYVEGAVGYDRIAGGKQAREVGSALGKFHRLTSGLDPDLLFDTLPGFHVTPAYLAQYDSVAGTIPASPSQEEERCAAYVEKFRDGAGLLEGLREKGVLKPRVIHGDPKVSNILFDENIEKALCLVDLDTVKPGLLHYDLGDCFRSACNPAGGDGEALDGVLFDVGSFAQVLEGYVSEMGDHLTRAEWDLIGPAVRLISFELGLRYFTDHLLGDMYFRADFRGRNLRRALGQFLLADDIGKKETEIRAVVDSFRSKN